MAISYPEFTSVCDPFDDPYSVKNLVLDEYIGWKPHKDALVMDIGANAGIWTAFCAIYGAKVTAYEADPLTFEILSKMVKSARLQDSVSLKHQAIWSGSGKIMFRGRSYHSIEMGTKGRNGCIQELNSGSHSAYSDHLVECVSLNDAIGDQEWDCIKMDIEGAEFEVLGAVSVDKLRQVRLFHVEFHNIFADSALYDSIDAKLKSVFVLEDGGPDRDEYNGQRFHWMRLRRM